jgi:hypothetical protein
MRKFLMVGAAMAVTMVSATSAQAIALLTASGGGYGQIAMPRNDDESSGLLTLPFQINFYGQTRNNFYVNNNGNITFSQPTGDFTPFSLGNLTQAMIAPWWADVDTRNQASGQVYVGSFAPGQLNVTWDNVGFFSNRADLTNSFQLNLYQVGSNGDFDIEFRYSQLQWTTGEFSGGINGLGGTPAIAGYTNGSGVDVLQPGSFLSPGALNMVTQSNVNEPGRWVYNIRNATPPPTVGSTPQNPILPTGSAPNDGYTFTFDVTNANRVFIDPPVATGYDFAITGSQFTSALFTSPLNDLDGYQLFSADGSTLLGNVLIGQVFNFSSPLSAFRLRGINPANLLVPGDPTAFVSGFTFSSLANVTITQTPFVENYTPPTNGAVPEPATWLSMIAGLGMVGGAMRRRQKVTVRYAL